MRAKRGVRVAEKKIHGARKDGTESGVCQIRVDSGRKPNGRFFCETEPPIKVVPNDEVTLVLVRVVATAGDEQSPPDVSDESSVLILLLPLGRDVFESLAGSMHATPSPGPTKCTRRRKRFSTRSSKDWVVVIVVFLFRQLWSTTSEKGNFFGRKLAREF